MWDVVYFTLCALSDILCGQVLSPYFGGMMSFVKDAEVWMEQRDKLHPQVNERKLFSLMVALTSYSTRCLVLCPFCTIFLLQDISHSLCVGSMLTGNVQSRPSTRQSCSHSQTSRMEQPFSRCGWWRDGRGGVSFFLTTSFLFAACSGPAHPVLPPVPKDPIPASVQDPVHT